MKTVKRIIRRIQREYWLMRLRLRGINLTEHYPLDEKLFREVFILEEYKIKGIKPKLIFDLGSNIGYASAYFKCKYPKAYIVAVEPNSGLKNTISDYVVDYAISDSSSCPDLNLYDKHHAGNSIYRKTDKSVKVKPISYQKLVEIYGKPDLVKFDIEGSEVELLPHLTDESYIGELHFDMVDIEVPEDAILEKISSKRSIIKRI